MNWSGERDGEHYTGAASVWACSVDLLAALAIALALVARALGVLP